MNNPNGFHIRSMQEAASPRPPSRRWPLRRRPAPSSSPLLTRLRAGWLWLVQLRRDLGWRRFIVRLGGIACLLGIAFLGYLWLTLPNVDDPTSLLAAQSTVVTDREGVELYRLYGKEDRTYVPLSQISNNVKNAVIAIEDERFYNHGCIEIRSIARAVFARVTGRTVTGGASTLTQQLARNALLTTEQTATRKLREIMLACEMERLYDKDKVVELYLNWIPFGATSYGVEQASRLYFGISAKDLTVPQAAVLASIVQRPSYFNPYGSHVRTKLTAQGEEKIREGRLSSAGDIGRGDASIGLLGGTVGTGSTAFYVGGRADQVLKNMEVQGYITEKQRAEAVETLKTTEFKPLRESIRAPHFVLWVKDQVENTLEENAEKGLLEQGGLTIQTTLNWKLQQAAEQIVAKHSEDVLKRFGANNIALVALDPKTKEVLAYVGNVDFSGEGKESKIDMAQAARAPGSSFKPFVYAAAFTKGYSPATVLHDVPTKFGDDQPQNYEGGFWGVTTIRRALAGSRNIPAIKAFFLAGGEEPILDLVEKMGAPTPKNERIEIKKTRAFDYGWPLALGAGETPLFEMVQGFSTLADEGRYKPAASIQKITDKRGALLPLDLPTPDDLPGEQVLDPRIAYEVTSILSDVAARPGEFWQNSLSVPGFQAAAKTGTSNKCLDRNERDGVCKDRKPDNVWTIGYTPNIVVGVWVGNATSEPLSSNADGLNVAAPIWKEFMIQAHKIIQVNRKDFPVPEGIVTPLISTLSGELPTECTPVQFRKPDIFLRENAPTLPDPACVTLTVDSVTNLLSSDSCPEEARVTKSFYLPRSIAADRWPQWEAGVQAWASSVAGNSGTGSSLPLPLAPKETCDVNSTPGRLIKPTLTIESPSDGDSATYPSFKPQIDFTVGATASGVTYILDGKQVAVSRQAPFEPVIRVPKTVEKDGLHTLEVILRDNYANVAKDSVTFRFSEDESAPSIHLTAPSDGAEVRRGASLTMSAVADDEGSGIKYIEFYLNDRLLSRKPQEPYELTYAVDLPPGEHTVRVEATDLAGKVADDEVTIRVTGSGAGVVTP